MQIHVQLYIEPQMHMKIQMQTQQHQQQQQQQQGFKFYLDVVIASVTIAE